MEHICCYSDCHEIRIYGSHYCHIHMCSFRKGDQYCTNKCIENCIYCEEHQNTYNSKNICNYEGCENIKQYGSRYCYEHTCKHPMCVNYHKIKCSGYYDELRIYCDNHRCSTSKCECMRQDDSTVCEKHECKFENCRNPLRYLHDKFCEKHVCRVCDECRCDSSEYCENHKCKYMGCMAINNFDKNYNCCEQHKCCADKCFNVVITNGKYCKYHACEYKDCIEIKLNIPYGRYCVDHSCQIPECGGLIMDGLKICKEHMCSEMNCKNSVFTGNTFNSPKFCDIHMCQYIKHPYEIRCNKRILDGKKYCSEHMCSEMNCKNSVFTGNTFDSPKLCDIHMCQYIEHPYEIRCNKRILDGKKYCSEHICCKCNMFRRDKKTH